MSLKHEPTDETRRLVKDASAIGIHQDDIAKLVYITGKTLREHYREELDIGMADVALQVGRKLLDKGLIDGDTVSLIWYTKARMGWHEKKQVDVNDVTDLSKQMNAGRARALAGRAVIDPVTADDETLDDEQ